MINYTISYFISGDGYFLRFNHICQWLVDTEVDCLITQGPPDAERYGRDVKFSFTKEEELIAFKLAYDNIVI